MISDRKVIKYGEVYRVHCYKTGELTLLVNCAECDQNKGYRPMLQILKCEHK